MTSDWPVNYPSKSALRREVQAAIDSWVEVLLDRLPDGAVRGIYFKGSAQKAWDSPVDYVPELSDVDLHLTHAPANRAIAGRNRGGGRFCGLSLGIVRLLSVERPFHN